MLKEQAVQESARPRPPYISHQLCQEETGEVLHDQKCHGQGLGMKAPSCTYIYSTMPNDKRFRNMSVQGSDQAGVWTSCLSKRFPTCPLTLMHPCIYSIYTCNPQTDSLVSQC